MALRFRREWSIDTVISLLLVLAALVGVYVGLSARMTALEVKVDAMWGRFVR